MASMWTAADLEELADTDSIEGATFTPVSGDPVTVDYLILDLGVQLQSPDGAMLLDTVDQITVRVSELDEDDLIENSSFTIAGTGPQAGTWRVIRVDSKDESFITVDVRKD